MVRKSLALLNEISALKPPFSVDLVAELIRHGDVRGALELLWDTLHDAGLTLPEALQQTLIELSRRAGVPESRWKP